MATYEITSSAELMENYLLADVLDPQDAFVALQTDEGASLLFSIGTDNAMYLTREVSSTAHGWDRLDLSTAEVKLDFPGGAVCSTFAAAQAAATAAGSAEIHLAMVLRDGSGDNVYISLGNSDSDTSWAEKPTWTPCPFNAKDDTGAPLPVPTPLHVAGVLISEATDGEYVVIDVVRDPTDTAGMIERFYLDVSKPEPQWNRHDVATDIEAAGYTSCLGRSSGAHGVDGLYTHGTTANATQLIYTPLYNVFAATQPPLASRLHLPGDVGIDAMAASRNADDTSDLYVVGQDALYRFASANQQDGAVADQVLSNPLLSGGRDLYASTADGTVTVWGLNGSNQVWYTTAPVADVASPGSWSTPITIMTEVDAISPYVDRGYSANTFFAHSAAGLVKAVKSPTTGLWNRHNVTLPPSSVMQDPNKISSYTTRIEVKTPDGQLAPGVLVDLTAATVTSVVINHLYYRVGPERIEVRTDSLGSITIVETALTLAATRFTAAIDTDSIDINPMDAPFQRNSQMDSVDKLRGATITNRDGTTRPFVPADTSDTDLQLVVTSNTALNGAYTKLSGTAPPMLAMSSPRPALAAAAVSDGILTDVGDLFSWLESGVDAIVSVVEDAAEDVWHFIAKIGDEIYEGILDCVEHVVAAVMWVYNAIKVVVEDIIAFLEFLFAWHDIVTTHQVLKNVFTQFAQSAVGELSSWKTDISSMFDSVESNIDAWASIPSFDQTPGGTASGSTPMPGQGSAPSNLGLHHVQGNATDATTAYSPPDPAEAVLTQLLDVVAAEEQVVVDACAALQTDILDNFSSLTVTQIMEKFTAILADTLLDSAENIIDAVLDLLIEFVDDMMEVLSATISIPVISSLYHDLTGDDLSFLDLMCLVAAIPATLIYKATTDSAPFPTGDAFTEGLKNAASFDEVKAQFVASPSLTTASALSSEALSSEPLSDDEPVLDQAKLKIFSVVAGVAALAGSAVLVITSTIQKALDLMSQDNAYPKTLASISCMGNIAYVSPNIPTLINAKTGTWYAQLNNAVTGVSILKGMVAIPFAASTTPAVTQGFAATETIINVVWNVPVIGNVVDNHAKSDTTYKSLIPETIGNFAFNLGGILEWPIALTKDPVTKLSMAAVQDVLMLLYGALMVTSGGIYAGAANQEH